MPRSRKTPCKIKHGRFVIPCVALEECIEGSAAFSKKKGIIVWNLINIETGQAARSYIGTKSGKYGKQGLIFNYCPFCATKIDAPVLEAEQSNSALAPPNKSV